MRSAVKGYVVPWRGLAIVFALCFSASLLMSRAEIFTGHSDAWCSWMGCNEGGSIRSYSPFVVVTVARLRNFIISMSHKFSQWQPLPLRRYQNCSAGSHEAVTCCAYMHTGCYVALFTYIKRYIIALYSISLYVAAA